MRIEIYMDIISNDGHFDLGTQTTALGQCTNEVSRERGGRGYPNSDQRRGGCVNLVLTGKRGKKN